MAEHTAPEEWLSFREHRNHTLAGQHGWLSLTGLYWLDADQAEVDSLPGRWSADATGAHLSADRADGLRLCATGEPVDGSLAVQLADEESLMWVQYGGDDGGRVVVELARRGGRYALRPRDAASPVLTGFTGVPTFDYRPDLVVAGRFEPYPAPVQVPIRTAHPRVPGTLAAIGEVVFSLAGTEYRLQVSDAGDGALGLTFHDGTNGTETAGWRSLALPAPAADGSVVLDFNRAVNYPSAFTPYGTCPMPADGNRIEAGVPAGEKRPDAG